MQEEELSDEERMFRSERAGGNYGLGKRRQQRQRTHAGAEPLAHAARTNAHARSHARTNVCLRTHPLTHPMAPAWAGTKEIQARNYQAKKDAEKQRRALFDAALAKFKSGKVEEVRGQAGWGAIDVGARGHGADMPA